MPPQTMAMSSPGSRPCASAKLPLTWTSTPFEAVQRVPFSDQSE